MKALGYVGIDSPQKLYSGAVKAGLLNEGKNGSNFTTLEAKEILRIVKEIAKPLDFDEGIEYNIDILNSVKQFSVNDLGEKGYSFENDAPAKENEQSTLIIANTAQTTSLIAGDVIMLPANELYIGGMAQKIVKIIDQSDGYIKILTTAPKPSELIGKDGVSLSGKVTANFSEHFTPASDVLFYSEEGELLNGDSSSQRANRGIRPEITLEGDKIAVKVENGGTFASATLERMDVSIRTNFEPEFNGYDWQINSFRAQLSQSASIEAGLSGETGQNWPSIHLGEVSIPLGASGFSAKAILFMTMSLEGKASITANFTGMAGVEYIKDGGVRTFKNSSANATINPAEVTAKFGATPTLMISFLLWDIADLAVGVGIAAKATAVINPTGVVCSDGRCYLYLNILALTDDCLLGEILDYSVNISIFDENNSPYMQKLHYEGNFDSMVKVPQCTQGFGSISVKVVDALNGLGLPCKITFTQAGATPIVLDTISGIITEEGIAAGTYNYVILSNGYILCRGTVIVFKNAIADLGRIELVKGGDGSIYGEITNALNGEKIYEAKFTLYNGYGVNAKNESSAQKVNYGGASFSDELGRYLITAPTGYYTLKTEKLGFKSNYVDVLCNPTANLQNVTLNPGEDSAPLGNLRIVLTWGSTPRDLDSHLCGPTVNGLRRFHTYYREKDYIENGKLLAFLDLDDTTSYGPETTTVYNMNTSGKYSFYVHDYTNRSNSKSQNLSISKAMVQVYDGENLVATYHVRPARVGTVWHVFDYNAATGQIIERDRMYSVVDPEDVGGARSAFTKDVAEDILNILNGLANKEELPPTSSEESTPPASSEESTVSVP